MKPPVAIAILIAGIASAQSVNIKIENNQPGATQ